MPRLSIVIPTYRRPEILKKTLECLTRQTVKDQLEVFVVSDGPDANTRTVAEKFPVKYFEVSKSQQGVARNEGVRHATGERVLFIGDDIFLEPDACEWHMKDAELRVTGCEENSSSRNSKPETRNPRAVLGFTTWDPELTITPVMRWLEQSGWQFGYPMLAAYAGKTVPAEIQHRFTYTSHISVPLEIAKSLPFLEDVRDYGWEDIEWGLRLKDAGIIMRYEPRAKAVHHHPMTLEQSLKRMETLGRTAVSMEARVPELNIAPKGLKLWAYKILSVLPTMSGKHRKAFLRGMQA